MALPVMVCSASAAANAGTAIYAAVQAQAAPPFLPRIRADARRL